MYIEWVYTDDILLFLLHHYGLVNSNLEKCIDLFLHSFGFRFEMYSLINLEFFLLIEVSI